MENRSTFFSSSFCRHIERTFSVRITTFKSSRAKFLVGYSGLGNESTTIAYNSPQTFFARDFLHISKAGNHLASFVGVRQRQFALRYCALCTVHCALPPGLVIQLIIHRQSVPVISSPLTDSSHTERIPFLSLTDFNERTLSLNDSHEVPFVRAVFGLEKLSNLIHFFTKRQNVFPELRFVPEPG